MLIITDQPSQSDPRTDQQLIAAANAGDESAFVALYERYRDWTVRLATGFTGNADDALDVLQETFTYFLRKFPGFHLTAGLTTFLYPAVKNLSLAARRKRHRLGSLDDATIENLPEPRSFSVDDSRSELSNVLSSLPAGQREVLLMRFVDDMRLEEIATALGIPLGTAKSRLHNALETLRSNPRVRDYFEIEPELK